MKKSNKGFSLVELIIVIAIMAILAMTIAPATIRYIDKSRKADDLQLVGNIASVSFGQLLQMKMLTLKSIFLLQVMQKSL